MVKVICEDLGYLEAKLAPKRKWTPEEDDFVRYYISVDPSLLSVMIGTRSTASIMARQRKLGVRPLAVNRRRKDAT